MKLELVAVGSKPPAWVREGVEEYRRRMPRECSVILTEIALAKRSKNSIPDQSRSDEAKKITLLRQPAARTIAMDIGGRQWSTPDLAVSLREWISDYPVVQFVIGGPDGLADEIISGADEVWSLSRLTFPHFLVPVLLVEQLYRAWTIINNHPYHR